MSVTRRQFIEGSLVTGTALMVFPACSRADQHAGAAQRPAYAELESQGLLVERMAQAEALFQQCTLCPRRCGVDRTSGATGYCRAPRDAVVSSHQPHFGEELPLTGRRGSGTIFFANCNLRCVFCQNWPIAHEGRGTRVTDQEVAGMMLRLQRLGCHNINLVTPTHVMPNILAALRMALGQGLHLPLVYNTGGYESSEIVRMLDGIVDIYMPDLKFMDAGESGRYLDARDYPEMARESIREMYRQVGPLQLDERGLAVRGLMIRHLVMPNRVSNAKAFVNWVAETLSTDVYVNIMSQYRVEYRAYEFPRIARAISGREFLEAMEWAEAAGLSNLDERSLAQRDRYRRR